MANDSNPDDIPWWRYGVVYEVYLRSFADGNADGTGDIAGLRSRLGYLADLGVDAIWITPWYVSPDNDGGYDVADYRDIDPRYGDLGQAEALIEEAHDHGLRVIIDLVPNHTSTEHRWFKAAAAADPGDPVRNRYEIHPGRGPDGAEPPADWRSVFGGPAWERLADGEWYLHIFDATQADLNWDSPEVRAEFLDIFSFWLDRGVDGIRIDVAHGLAKDKTFPSMPQNVRLLDTDADDAHPYWDRDELHEIIREWRSLVDTYDGDRMMVAEAWVRPERLSRYLRSDEYHQSFNFALVEAGWDPTEWRDLIDRSIAAVVDVGSTPTWTLSNHDVMRHTTRFGLPEPSEWREWLVHGPADALDADAGLRRGLAATMLMLALPGSAYVYQGEELGLPDVWDLPTDVLDDPVFTRSEGAEKGRDGCRVPLPWTPDGPSFDFGDDGAWLPQPDRFGPRSVAAQAHDEDSTLNLYRRALSLRRQHLPADTSLEWLDLDLGEDVLAFRRSNGLLSVTNFGTEPALLPDGEVVLCTTGQPDGVVPGEATVWLVTS